MHLTRTLAAVAALTASLGAAHADLKIVQRITIDSPQLKAMMKNMSPQQRAMMAQSGNPLLSGAPTISTTYSHGSKTRSDFATFSVLTDTAAHKVTMIDRASHTYSVTPYNPARPMAGSHVQATVRDTGRTKVILGHPSKLYALTLTTSSLQGGRMTGDIWAAQDIPLPPSATVGGGPLAALQSQWKKVKGFPIQAVIRITGNRMGATTISTTTTSISKAPLPASTFTVPAGYQKSASPAMPSPMGR